MDGWAIHHWMGGYEMIDREASSVCDGARQVDDQIYLRVFVEARALASDFVR